MLLSIVLRLALCSGITYLAWRSIGPVGLAVCAPLFGLALAKPIVDSLTGFARLARQLAYRDIDGRHYAHRGRMIDIVEDPAHYRWLKVADVRKIVINLPSDQVLRQLFPAGLQSAQSPPVTRIKAESLAEYLEKSTDPESLRFKRWLEREVAFPARQLRDRECPSR